jgi:hypothetical protein
MSIVDYKVFTIVDGKLVLMGPMRNLETVEGAPLYLSRSFWTAEKLGK